MLLPPKLFKAGTGFWDGVVKMTRQPFDLETQLPLDVKSAFAVTKITVDEKPSLINQPARGGFGGYVMFENTNVSAIASDVYFYSKPVTFKSNDKSMMKISLSNEDGIFGGNVSEYAIYLTTTTTEELINEASGIPEKITKLEKEILLKDWSKDYGELEINISDILEKNGIESFTGSIAFVINKKNSSSDIANYILIEKCIISSDTSMLNDTEKENREKFNK